MYGTTLGRFLSAMIDPADLRQKLDEGRAAVVAGLRGLADELDRLDLPDVAGVMARLGPHFERFRREAERVFRRD